MPEFNVTTVNIETASETEAVESGSFLDKTSQQSIEELQRQQTDPIPTVTVESK